VGKQQMLMTPKLTSLSPSIAMPELRRRCSTRPDYDTKCVLLRYLCTVGYQFNKLLKEVHVSRLVVQTMNVQKPNNLSFASVVCASVSNACGGSARQ
jgi:hypothetical protein